MSVAKSIGTSSAGDGVRMQARSEEIELDFTMRIIISTPSPPRRSPPPINRGGAPSGLHSAWYYSLLITHYSLTIMPLINFGTLAQRYYPDKTYRTATRLFRRELEVTKGLLHALKRVGYSPTSRLLTSTQVRVIEEFIGEAG